MPMLKNIDVIKQERSKNWKECYNVGKTMIF